MVAMPWIRAVTETKKESSLDLTYKLLTGSNNGEVTETSADLKVYIDG
jgi:hypothetical protein